MVISIPFGLYVMMIGNCFSAILSSVINASPNKKLLNYGYKEQIMDMLPAIFLSVVMGVCVLPHLSNSLPVFLILMTNAHLS